MTVLPFLALLLLAGLVCFLLTRLARRMAWRYGWLDHPLGRKDHAEPTALLGGVALFATLCGLPSALLAVVAVVPIPSAVLRADLVSELLERAPTFLAVVGSALPLFLVGLVDDRRSLPPLVKLMGQFAAGGIVVGAGVQLELFGHDLANLLGTLLWIALVGNAFNFFDNMDGLLAGVAGISAALFLGLMLALEQYALAAWLAVYVGACAGFLPENFPRARIFMGDAGSLVLGHVFAVLCVQATFVPLEGSSWVAWIVPPSLLALPLLDFFYVLLDRWRDGYPLHRGDHRHVSHRLRRLGISSVRAALILWLATFVMGSFAIVLPYARSWIVLVCLAGQVAFFLLLNALLEIGRRERAPG